MPRRRIGATGASGVAHQAQATRARPPARFRCPGLRVACRAVNDTPSGPHQHTPFDVVAIGSALVDVLTDATLEDLQRFDMVKGSMTLVDLARAAALYKAMGPAVEVSGGSAANTAVGVAELGGRVGYLGKVAADELGEVFLHDITAAGVVLGRTARRALERSRRRPRHGAMPGARHRGRGADDGHPPGSGVDDGPRGS